jgi:hypothetical protein
MPLSPQWSYGILQLIFQAASANTTNIAVASTLGTNTSLWLSLHTAAPTTNSQATSEAAYTSYTRIPIFRGSTAGAFTATQGSSAGAASSISPNVTLSFPQATGGGETETYFGIGLSSAGAGTLLLSGSISPTLAVSNGVTPQLTTGTAITIV